MPSLDDMKRLVAAHEQLPEAMETAIWIRRDEADVAWLVEVVPELAEDEHVAQPLHFTPGRDFRYPLRLIAGNRDDIARAIRQDPEFAALVRDGTVLSGPEVGGELQALAAQNAPGRGGRA